MQSHNLKEIAARYAVNNYVQQGMNIGLGSGSTSAFAVAALAEKVTSEGLMLGKLVATSDETADLARFHGLSVEPDLTLEMGHLDVTIDGADEVDNHLNLIKGGGGALLREKLVAAQTKREVIIVDASKVVQTLGLKHPLPVMIVPYSYENTLMRIESVVGRKPIMRHTPTGEKFISNDGLYCVDIPLGEINNPLELEQKLKAITGVVDVGLFIGLTRTLVIAESDGKVTVKEAN
jgi:ribose 5-phosphate isomerase A